MTKREHIQQLANGEITVWHMSPTENLNTVINHRAGLTIALNDAEEEELLAWLQEDVKRKKDIAELKDFVNGYLPIMEALDDLDKDIVLYYIARLRNEYKINVSLKNNIAVYAVIED